ncbi:hypothetical protein MMC06_001964 [Schaereria dolodes]|nr:hypothetical protein [Schaereria dolodes]
MEDDKIGLLSTNIKHDSKESGAQKTSRNGNNKSSAKHGNEQLYLDVPTHTSLRPSLDTLSNLSIFSVETNSGGGVVRSDPATSLHSRVILSPRSWKVLWAIFWQKNKGLILVLISQLFGALMNVTTRLLETDGSHGEAMYPFQILFVRMGITSVLSSVWMWWTKVQDFPFGKPEVRRLLVLRGVGGFWGVYGMYYSLVYLPIAEAVVLTFLAPLAACWACSVLLQEPFTRMEQVAGIISLLGVVLIARPTSLFSTHGTTPALANGVADVPPLTNATTIFSPIHPSVTPAQRLGAVGVAMIGVLGAAIAYTTIRWIGKRAHPLISVNYFATWCTFISFLSFFVLPSASFRLPSSAREWIYLFVLGSCGFVMQFLLTAGLQHEKSSRATNMVYTQMLFALAFDKIVWGTSPGVWSLVGSSLILGSALYVAVQSNSSGKKVGVGEGRADEELGLVAGGRDEAEEDDIVDRVEEGPLRGVQEVQLRAIRV